jgi:hypothetical protein
VFFQPGSHIILTKVMIAVLCVHELKLIGEYWLCHLAGYA